MTRRKQNYPKRLNCSTEDLTSESHPVVADAEEEASEEVDEEAVDTDESDERSQISENEIHEDIPKTIRTTTKCDQDAPSLPKKLKSTSSSPRPKDVHHPVRNEDENTFNDKAKLDEFGKIKPAQTNGLDNTKEKHSHVKSRNMNNNYKMFEVADLNTDQPLDLSTKSKEISPKSSSPFVNGNSETVSSSLKSLQLRFGGDFNIEPPQKPSSIVPLQPTHQQTKPSKYNYQSTTQPPPVSSQIKANIKPQFVKKEKSTFTPVVAATKKLDSSVFEEDARVTGNKYTTHRCSCLKSYTTLQALSSHIQSTGHTPANSKAATLLDYPKLVRGQDMWLNQESEQTRRILRCMQCGESFQSLPMLTVHMMKTQHYTKIVSADHGRRSHKCSAYCEKELERECVFKCKVCQEAFMDMEGLANHMVQSGHHKKQVLRAQNYSEFTLRNRRKRYHSEEGNGLPLFDVKRKCLAAPNSILDDDDSDISVHQDSTITCENCGKKIEMKHFVDHVRACIRQKSSVIGVLKTKLLSDDTLVNKSDCENLSSLPPSPQQPSDDIPVKHSQSPQKETPSKVHVSQNLKSRILEAFSPRKQKIHENSSKSTEENVPKHEQTEVNSKKRDGEEHVDEKQDNRSSRNPSYEESKVELHNGQIKIKSEPIDECDSRETTPVMHAELDNKSDVAPEITKMDILDPNAKVPEANSALQAMESFIQKSFTSKFDFRSQNSIPVPSNFQKTSTHSLKRETSAPSDGSPVKYSKYRHLYNALHHKEEKNGHSRRRLPLLHSSQLKSTEPDSNMNASTSNSDCEDEPKQADRGTPEKDSNSRTSSPHANHSIVEKYLNLEEDGAVDKKQDSSALDSLSSFVYSQPMTSEHPLDSLQRLLTKTDIPKVLSRHFDIPYLPGIPEMSLPLNLSLKSNFSDDEDPGDGNGSLVVDVGNDEMSSNEERASPVSEGEQRDYKCAACSRHFVSKGSYRYHLSRCHLSSVRKYGIKEAFNMSPYIYLPLDHTAKFSKYYEMAYELANKGK